MAFLAAPPESGQDKAKKAVEPSFEQNYDAAAALHIGKLHNELVSICQKPMLIYLSSIGENKLNDELGNVDAYLAKMESPQEKALFLINHIGQALVQSVRFYYDVYASNYAKGNAPNIHGFSVPNTIETRELALQAMYNVASGTAEALSADTRSQNFAAFGKGLKDDADRIRSKINWKDGNSMVEGIRGMHEAQEEYLKNANITAAKIQRVNKISADYGLPQWAAGKVSDLEDVSGLLLVLGAAAISIRKGDSGKAGAAVTALFGAMGAQTLLEGANENDWRKMGLGLALMWPVGRMAAMARGAGWASSFGAEAASTAGSAFITTDMLQNIYNTSRLGFSTKFTDDNLRSVISDASMLFAPQILHIQLAREAKNVEKGFRGRFNEEVEMIKEGKATRSYWEGLLQSGNQTQRVLSEIVLNELEAGKLRNETDTRLKVTPVRTKNKIGGNPKKAAVAPTTAKREENLSDSAPQTLGRGKKGEKGGGGKKGKAKESGMKKKEGKRGRKLEDFNYGFSEMDNFERKHLSILLGIRAIFSDRARPSENINAAAKMKEESNIDEFAQFMDQVGASITPKLTYEIDLSIRKTERENKTGKANKTKQRIAGILDDYSKEWKSERGLGSRLEKTQDAFENLIDAIGQNPQSLDAPTLAKIWDMAGRGEMAGPRFIELFTNAYRLRGDLFDAQVSERAFDILGSRSFDFSFKSMVKKAFKPGSEDSKLSEGFWNAVKNSKEFAVKMVGSCSQDLLDKKLLDRLFDESNSLKPLGYLDRKIRDDMIGSWLTVDKIKEPYGRAKVVQANMERMLALEGQRNGAVGLLAEKQGVRNFERLDLALLVSQFDNWMLAKVPGKSVFTKDVAVVILPFDDHNGAFSGKPDMFNNIRKNFDVVYFEAKSRDGAIRALETANYELGKVSPDSRQGIISALFIGGHGGIASLSLGSGPTGKVTQRSLEVEGLPKYFTPRPFIGWISCITGASGGLAHAGSFLYPLSIHYAPPSTVRHLPDEIIYAGKDKKGRPLFEFFFGIKDEILVGNAFVDGKLVRPEDYAKMLKESKIRNGIEKPAPLPRANKAQVEPKSHKIEGLGKIENGFLEALGVQPTEHNIDVVKRMVKHLNPMVKDWDRHFEKVREKVKQQKAEGTFEYSLNRVTSTIFFGVVLIDQ